MIKEGVKTFRFVKTLKDLRSTDEMVSERAYEYITELLSQDGGLLLKATQYLGTTNDKINTIIRPDHIKNESGLSALEIKKILDEKFPKESSRVENISENAYYASIGQVNRGILDGTTSVAIKTQYPKIKQVLKKQLQLLKLLPIASLKMDVKKWGVDFKKYQLMIEKVLEHECNYHNECVELKKWQEYTKDLENIIVPKVYTELESENQYIQDFIEGKYISDIKEIKNPAEKKILANSLVKSFFTILAHHHCCQGDTNFGNYLFTDDNKVAFIDLGQVVYLDEKKVFALFKALDNEYNSVEYSKLGLMLDLGFDAEKLKHFSSRVDLLVDVLLEPLTADYAFNLKDWKYQENIDRLLGEEKWWFRSAGSTEFFLLMKSFMGLKNLIIELESTVFFKKIIKEVLTSINLSEIEITPELVDGKYLSVPRGKFLNIELWRSGVKKVDMSMPLEAIFDIDDYLDDEIKNKIRMNKLDLNKLIFESLKDGGQVKEILCIEEDLKKIHISIKNKKATV